MPVEQVAARADGFGSTLCIEQRVTITKFRSLVTHIAVRDITKSLLSLYGMACVYVCVYVYVSPVWSEAGGSINLPCCFHACLSHRHYFIVIMW